MIFLKYEGNDKEVNMQALPCEEPYTELGDKAFLSCKSIKKLVLPDTITRIGNWGLAHMKQLEELVVTPSRIELGKEVFLDCPNLSKICVLPDETDNPGIPYLLATVVTKLEDYRLFQPDQAAGLATTQAWLGRYDESLLRFLYAPDDEGFRPVLIGWFDDEGEDSQRTRFCKERQEEKAKLCFLRLQYDTYLTGDAKEKICQYMLMHVPGGAKEKEHTAIWDLLRTEYGKDIGTIKRLEKYGILDAKRRVLLIDFLNRHQGNPEVLSYLLAAQQRENHENFFVGLDL